MPLTNVEKSSYLDLIRDEIDEQGKPYVAPATVFISHAWKYKIAEPLDVMLEHGEKNPDAYFWFDLFTNNQHRASQLPQEWWKTTFRTAIGDIGAVTLVMSPWNDPIPITRAWCLWEILSALDQPHVKFRIRFPRSMRTVFFESIVQNPDHVLSALSNIQAEKAEAFLKDDLDMIFEAIRSTVGFRQMNTRVNEQLREWYVKTAVEIADEEVMLIANSSEDDTMDQKIKVARMQHQVGSLLADFGDHDGAINHFQKALVMNRATVGEDHPNTAHAYNRLGLLYDLKADFDKALDHLQRGLACQVKILGTDHTDTATTYNNLGLVYNHKGDQEQALETYYKALAIVEKKFGQDHLETAPIHSNIGSIYDSRGQLDDAMICYSRTLKIVEKALGENHPEVATPCNLVGLIYQKKGELTKAMEYFQRCIIILEKTVGENHPQTAMCLGNLGLLYQNQGDVESALQYSLRALKIEEHILGSQHPSTATSYNNLGLLYRQKGEIVKALEYYNHALEIRRKVLGEDSAAMANSYNNIGAAHQSAGALDLAIYNFERGLTIQEKLLGLNHVDVATSYNNIGTLHQTQSNLDSALEYFQKALNIWEKVLGKGHLETAMAYNNMGMIYYRKGDVEHALECLRQFSEILEKHFGPQHPQVIATKQGIEKLQEEQQALIRERQANQTQHNDTRELLDKEPLRERQGQERVDFMPANTANTDEEPHGGASNASNDCNLVRTDISSTAKQRQGASREKDGENICCRLM